MPLPNAPAGCNRLTGQTCRARPCICPKASRDPVFEPKQPTESEKRKAQPMATGLLDYFPDALAAVAQLSKHGNDKHNPGQALHWSREKSNDHADCIMRHLKDRGTWDVDNDCLHDVAVAWRSLALAQLAIEKAREEAKK